MKNQLNESDLLYFPNYTTGKYLHDGMPCPTIEAHDILGDKGVQIIHDRIATMLEWRKTMFGERQIEDYGFTSREKFIELQNETVLLVGRTINMEVKDLNSLVKENDMLNYLPDLVINDKFKKNNYQKLLNHNHYLIEVEGKHTLRPKNADPASYYRKTYL